MLSSLDRRPSGRPSGIFCYSKVFSLYSRLCGLWRVGGEVCWSVGVVHPVAHSTAVDSARPCVWGPGLDAEF